MNYRHAFHAGNHADVLKHVVLLCCLDALKRKPTPFGVLDTHAGCGLYDLFSAEAMRSPEWRDGIGALWDWADPPTPVAALTAAVRAHNGDGVLRYYPGSPLLIADALRAGDTLEACEVHPEDIATLRRVSVNAANVRVHARDGWEALTALLPPKQRRGLVLIDPPYEQPGELPAAAHALAGALKRFGHGMFLWWRPLKTESELARCDAEISAQGATKMLRADFWIDTPSPQGPLNGSSMMVVNPPFGLDKMLREALPALAARLTHGRSGWRVA